MVPAAASWYTGGVSGTRFPDTHSALPIGLAAALCGTVLACPSSARAGLYYSGEQFAELPSQWRGLLLDLRTLRGIAVKPAGTVENLAFKPLTVFVPSGRNVPMRGSVLSVMSRAALSWNTVPTLQPCQPGGSL